MNKILLAIIFIISTMAFAEDEAPAPTSEQLLDKIESNSVYKEVVDKGFTEKNKNLDLAILEVMATKKITELTSKGLSEVQLDLLGPILAYGNKAKKLPEKLITAFRKSPNLRFTIKNTTILEEGNGEYFTSSCFEPDMDPVIVFPEDYDIKFENGKTYAKISSVDKQVKGTAEFQYMLRALVVKDRREVNDSSSKFDKSVATLKSVQIGDSTMKPEDIQKKLTASKSKTIWLTVHPWNIQKHEEIAGGKGALLNISSSFQPAPPMIVRIPFKEFVQHAKMAGWEGKMRPGCDTGDAIEILAEFKGKKTITNEKGVLVEVAIVEAVAINDGYGFYKK